MNDYSPLDTFKRALGYWPLVALLTILGGLAGWLVFSLRQPLYESRIEFTFNIDYARIGVLTDVEEDQAMEAAGDIFGSSAVMDAVVSAARANGTPITLPELQAAAVRERTASTWRLRIRAASPDTAAYLANAWGEQADKALSAASRHAINVDGLSRYLDSLESCLSSSASAGPAQVLCSAANLADLQARLEETGAAIHVEKQASLGMLPGMGYQWTEKGVPAARPVVNGRGMLILAGALIGFVLAVTAALGGWLPSLQRKRAYG